ncbi:hypothetical protein AB835_01610 [Candidatus Endobugula sertula]|uniref:Uncharacterized protein n=1 Tax=Candidatus Endobugula sertula TaxID=62101 RepID=A0A1D2QT90_9GAMM|nr:hypothetical protein AB835_01610 [Candidatus Endobugula sertula]
MTDNTPTTANTPTQAEPTESQNDRHRKPDYYVQLAQEGRHGREKITDVGVLWSGKDGYLTGDTIAGRVIVQPREKREELQRIRAERQQGIQHNQQLKH